MSATWCMVLVHSTSSSAPAASSVRAPSASRRPACSHSPAACSRSTTAKSYERISRSAECIPPSRRRASSFKIRSYTIEDSQLIPPSRPITFTALVPSVPASASAEPTVRQPLRGLTPLSRVPPEHEHEPVIEFQNSFWVFTLDFADPVLKLSVVELGQQRHVPVADHGYVPGLRELPPVGVIGHRDGQPGRLHRCGYVCRVWLMLGEYLKCAPEQRVGNHRRKRDNQHAATRRQQTGQPSDHRRAAADVVQRFLDQHSIDVIVGKPDCP